MKHVASHAGVSIATVSRVINGHSTVAEPTRCRVLQAMDHLGYSPSVAAQALVTKGKTRQIGVVVHKIDHPFYADFASAFHIEATQHGYSSLVLEAQGMSLVDILRDLRARQVEGVVLAVEDLPERSTGDVKAEFERLVQSDIPIVVVDEVCDRGIAAFPAGVSTIPVDV